MRINTELQLSGKKLSGYIARYGELSLPSVMPNGRKVYLMFAPGAFAPSVDAINAKSYSINANVEHEGDDALKQLGSTLSNIRLDNRADGVWAEIDLLDEFVSDAIHAKVKSGAIGGFSVEADYPKDREPQYRLDASGDYIKVLDASIGLRLTGFGVVTHPKFPQCVAVAAADDSQPDPSRVSIRCAVEQTDSEQQADAVAISAIESEKKENKELSDKLSNMKQQYVSMLDAVWRVGFRSGYDSGGLR